MLDRMDKALKDLTEMACEMVDEAKNRGTFNKDFVETICIIFSMSYGRFRDNDK